MGDLVHAVRLFRRAPLQSVTVAVVVAVAVFFATAFFTVYHDLAAKSVPGVSGPGKLVSVGLSDGESFDPVPGAVLETLGRHSRNLVSVFSQRRKPGVEIELEGRWFNQPIVAASPEFFRGLGVDSAQGRPLRPEDGAGKGDRVAVLAHDFWMEAFGGDPGVIGDALWLDGHEFRIVGVADPAFAGMHPGDAPAIWVPRAAWVHAVYPELSTLMLDDIPVLAGARLVSGRDIATAREELFALSDELAPEYPKVFDGRRLTVLPGLHPDPRQVEHTARQAGLLTGAAVLLAVIAAGNLGLFFLARIPERGREMGIRMALGATRGRLARQLLTESSVLVVAGGVLGLLLALWLSVALRELPLFENVVITGGVDWPVIGFALLLLLVLAAVVAIAPAVQLLGRSLAARTRELHTRTGRGQQAVTAVQVLIAAPVLAAGLLFGQGLWDSVRQESGFNPTGVLVVESEFDLDGPFDFIEGAVFDLRLAVRQGLETLEGVEAVAFGSAVPGGRHPETHKVDPDNGQAVRARLAHVSPDWADVLSASLLHGTLPDSQDRGQALVSRRFAEAVWGETAEAVGREVLAPPMLGGVFQGLTAAPHTVTGVLENIALSHPAETVRPTMFLTYPGPLDMTNAILVRGHVSPEILRTALEPVLAANDPPLRLVAIQDLAAEWRATLAEDISRSVLTGIAAVLVVALAVLGFFGSLRFAVESSRFEYALRAVVGADPRSLRRQVMRRGLALGLPGLVPGVLVAAIVLFWLRDKFDLAHLPVWPALTVTTVGLGLLLMLAILPTALRVARREPGPMLREE